MISCVPMFVMPVVLHYFLPFLFSFILSLLLTPFGRRFAIRLGIFDIPDSSRKLHVTPVPLLGGFGMFLAFVTTSSLFAWFGFLQDTRLSPSVVMWILISGALLMVGGALDDRFRLKPWQHIWFPLSAVVLVVMLGGVDVGYVTNPFSAGTGPYGRSLVYMNPTIIGSIGLGSVIAIVWLLFTIYATKFLDGVEGLVAGLGTISSFVLFVISLFWDVPLSGTSTLIAIFGGSLFGLWVHNVKPLNLFLGDGGGMFIGFMLGVLSILSGAKIATTLLVFGLPFVDAVVVVTERLVSGVSPFSGDRRHLHFRLRDLGWSQRHILLLYGFVSLAFGVSAVVLTSTTKAVALGTMVLLMLMFMVIVTKISKHKIPNKSQ